MPPAPPRLPLDPKLPTPLPFPLSTSSPALTPHQWSNSHHQWSRQLFLSLAPFLPSIKGWPSPSLPPLPSSLSLTSLSPSPDRPPPPSVVPAVLLSLTSRARAVRHPPRPSPYRPRPTEPLLSAPASSPCRLGRAPPRRRPFIQGWRQPEFLLIFKNHVLNYFMNFVIVVVIWQYCDLECMCMWTIDFGYIYAMN
jgi:hypothetical protein